MHRCEKCNKPGYGIDLAYVGTLEGDKLRHRYLCNVCVGKVMAQQIGELQGEIAVLKNQLKQGVKS